MRLSVHAITMLPEALVSENLCLRPALFLLTNVSLIAPEDRNTFVEELTLHIFGNAAGDMSEHCQILKVRTMKLFLSLSFCILPQKQEALSMIYCFYWDLCRLYEMKIRLFFLLQCLDKYGKKFLGIIRFRLLILGERDYFSCAMSVLAAPCSKHVLEESSNATLLGGPQRPTLHPATNPFHEHKLRSKTLLEVTPFQFSNLTKGKLLEILAPYLPQEEEGVTIAPPRKRRRMLLAHHP